jgi:hypothetical protein
MALIDFDKLASEYGNDDDFGFSAVSEAEYNSVINKTAQTADDYRLVQTMCSRQTLVKM